MVLGGLLDYAHRPMPRPAEPLTHDAAVERAMLGAVAANRRAG